MQPLRSRGSPNKGTKSELAASPLPSRGPKRGRKCYVTPTFSGVPKQGDKIRIGCITSAFSRAQKRGKVLRNPYVLGGPQTRGHNQKWPPHPCLLGVPKEGENAIQSLHSRRSPTKGTKSEVKIHAKGNNDAPSISKYGSLVRPGYLHCAKCAPLVHPLKGHWWGTRQKRCPAR